MKILLLGITLMGCTSTNNKLVLDSIKKQIPNDNFYFIRGLERDRSLSTNIRYRGIVYSDKLREEKAFAGIQVALEDMDELWKYEEDFVRQYENALIEEAKIKYLISSINVLSSDVNNYIQYTPFTLKPDENDEVGVYVIGQLSNVTLAGIKGGVESQLIKIKERKKKEETRGLKLSNQSNEKYSQNFSSKGGFKFNGRGEYCD